MTVVEQDLDKLDDLPLRDARLIQFLEYWRSLRGDLALPRYRDVDPIAIPKLLSHVWCWSYDREQDTFRGRLAGEAVMQVYGTRDMRGLALNELVEQPLAGQLHARYRRVVTTPMALHFQGSAVLDEGETIRAERLALPLCDRTTDSRVIIGLSLYDRRPGLCTGQGFVLEEGRLSWAPID